MLDQRFNSENIHKSLTASLVRRHRLVAKDGVELGLRYRNFTDQIENKIYQRGFFFGGYNEYIHKKTNKITYSFVPEEGFEGDVVSRRLDFLLRRIFRINFKDRFVISSQLKSIFESDFSGTVIRLDIASFYESLNPSLLKNYLINDRILASETKEAIEVFFDSFSEHCSGVPRGISLSSTLSEIAMKQFDRRVSSIPGVYYYARYVDDIIVLTKGRQEFLSCVSDILLEGLTEGLSFNNKTKVIKLNSVGNGRGTSLSSEQEDRCHHLNYLGYKYMFNKNSGVMIDVSDAKIKKIKTKIHHSFYSFRKNKDLELLFDRLSVLSASYPVSKSDEEGVGTLKGGMCYVYGNINSYDGLRDLDKFICSYLCRYGLSLFSWQFSFFRNFKSKEYMCDITSSRMSQIKKVWENV